MENAAEALKLSAMVLIFVGAVSLAIVSLTKVQQTATSLLTYSDPETYNADNIRMSTQRMVGIETVIPTMYSYFKEGYTILFYTGTYIEDEDRLESIKPLTLYYSEANTAVLLLSTLTNDEDAKHTDTDDSTGKIVHRAIYGIDTDDENTRQEFWQHDDVHAKYFIQSLVNNTPEISPYSMSRPLFATDSPNHLEDGKLTLGFEFYGGLYDVLDGRLDADGRGTPLARATNARFIERIGTYNQVVYEVDNTTVNTAVDGSIIEFSNNEVIQNEEGTQKRVIQYIYIGNRY